MCGARGRASEVARSGMALRGGVERVMAARIFPLWIAVRRKGRPPVAVVNRDRPGYVAAFTTLEAAQAFVAEREGNWELRLVCRVTFRPLARRLRRYGLVGVCF